MNSPKSCPKCTDRDTPLCVLLLAKVSLQLEYSKVNLLFGADKHYMSNTKKPKYPCRLTCFTVDVYTMTPLLMKIYLKCTHAQLFSDEDMFHLRKSPVC